MKMSDEKNDSLFVEVKPGTSKKAQGSAAPKVKDVRKRWIYLGIGLLIFVVVAATLFSSPPAKQNSGPPKQNVLLNVTPRDLDKKSWEVQSQATIQAVKDQNDNLQSELSTLKDQIQALKQQKQTAASAPVPAGGNVPPPGTSPPSVVEPSAGVVPPPPTTSPGTANLPQQGFPNSINGVGTGQGSALPPIPPPYENGSGDATPMIFAPPKPSKPAIPSDEVAAKVSYKKNQNSGLMVAGAFAPIVLLNGIDAGTSSGARSNPLPVLMRIQNNAILPGASHYQLKSCFLLGSGYGDLSSERVYIRLARLSCVDKANRLVLSAPVQGYVVDSDNTLGMRGKVVDRQGAKLGKALLAGFAQGLSGALGGAQGTMTTSALGAATSLTGTEALKASGFGGISNAASQLAQFYLKEAETIFPVIEISGGRTGTVVFTEDTRLHWGNVDAQFVRDVTPTNHE